MPFQRGNPKPLGSGRIKGIPNKRTLAAAAMAVGASDAYDPAYDDLKRMAVQFKEWIAEEKKRKPLRMGRLITLHDRLARILEKTCQYEKPKLQAITLAGCHNLGDHLRRHQSLAYQRAAGVHEEPYAQRVLAGLGVGPDEHALPPAPRLQLRPRP